MRQQPRQDRARELTRGLGALVVLLVLLAGVPAGLTAVGGSPIPHAFPTWPQITTTLTRPDTDNTLFLATIKVIGWAAWLLFTATTLTETAGYLRGRPSLPLPRPIRPMQYLARDLVAAAALIISAGGPISPSTTVSTHQSLTATEHAVRPMDRATHATLAALSSGNRQDPAPGTAAHPRAQTPRPWRIHVIKRGDTLWGIARHSYGTGGAYMRIFNASRDLRQPHGLPHLTDPDRVYPGQHIKVPATGRPAARSPHLRQLPRTDAPTAPSTIGQPRPHVPALSRPPVSPAEPAPASSAPPAAASPTPAATTPAPSRRSAAPSHPAPSGGAANPTGSQAVPRTPPPSPPTPSKPTESPVPGQPQRSAPETVTLPTGAFIGLGLATAISIAVAASRLHRRRRRVHVEEWPAPTAPEPAATPAPIATARKAHLDTYVTRNAPIPSDADLVTGDLTAPTPTQITAGVRDGHDLTLELSGLSLGLTGPGALAAVRAIATELLARSHRYRVELCIPESDAAAIFAETGNDVTELAADLPGLTIAPSLGAAITHLEAEFIHRARLMETTDEPDVSGLRAADPGEPLPALILIATAPTGADALQAMLRLGRRYCVGGLLLGRWTAGTTLRLAADGAVTDANGPTAGTWPGARLFNLTPADAGAMLRVIRTANGAPERHTPSTAATAQSQATGPAQRPQPRPPQARSTPATAPVPHSGTEAADEGTPRPVQLHILGPIRIEAAGKSVATGVRRITRDLLVYLALNPDGITREQGIEALLPDRDIDSGTTMFHTAINNARRTLRSATGLREPMFIIHAGSRYHLDSHLIDVDLWRLRAVLAQARGAAADSERIEMLRLVPDLYTADLAEDITHEWAETEREHLRHQATGALTHLARLTQSDNPDKALAALEQAIQHDPYAEPLYRAVMRLQARLRRSDAVRRTYQILTNRLADLDAEPDDETHQLHLELLRAASTDPNNGARTRAPAPASPSRGRRPTRP